jgi:N-acetyl-alpha-D-muramate 1-phosphate uridylyltransferase
MQKPSISLVLLAGGLANRLRPLTESVPKALLEVAGEPFIAHQLRLLKREDVQNIVICAGYLGEKIQDFVQNGKHFGINVSYSFDGDTLLGTGGAIVQSLPLLNDIFWVMYGDSYLDISFHPILKSFYQSDKPGLMTVLRNEGLWDQSNVLFEGNKILKYDKFNPITDMKHIDYGLGLFRKSTFEPWKNCKQFDLAEVYSNLVKQDQLAGYEVSQRFYEIGSLKGLEETQKYLSRFKGNGEKNEPR